MTQRVHAAEVAEASSKHEFTDLIARTPTTCWARLARRLIDAFPKVTREEIYYD